MVSRNNVKLRRKLSTERQVPHYSLRKLGIGVVSVLLSTTLYFGANNTLARADTTDNAEGESDAVSNTTTASAQTQLSSSQVTLPSSSVKSTSTSASAAVQSQSSQAASNAVSAQSSQPVSAQGSNAGGQEGAVTDKQATSSSASQENSTTSTLKVAANSLTSQTPAELTANKAETTDRPTYTIDNSHNYTSYQKGQAATVSMADGSTLSLDHNIISYDNSDASKQVATLTFKSNSFKSGDTYTIEIPAAMVESNFNQTDVASLPASLGTTTFTENNGYDTIIDKFTANGSSSVSQNISLKTTPDVYTNLFKEYGGQYAPYDLLKADITISKNKDTVTNLGINYQMGTLVFPGDQLENKCLQFDNVNAKLPVSNDTTITLGVYQPSEVRTPVASATGDIYSNDIVTTSGVNLSSQLVSQVTLPNGLSLVNTTGELIGRYQDGSGNLQSVDLGSVPLEKTSSGFKIDYLALPDSVKQKLIKYGNNLATEIQVPLKVHVDFSKTDPATKNIGSITREDNADTKNPNIKLNNTSALNNIKVMSGVTFPIGKIIIPGVSNTAVYPHGNQNDKLYKTITVGSGSKKIIIESMVNDDGHTRYYDNGLGVALAINYDKPITIQTNIPDGLNVSAFDLGIEPNKVNSIKVITSHNRTVTISIKDLIKQNGTVLYGPYDSHKPNWYLADLTNQLQTGEYIKSVTTNLKDGLSGNAIIYDFSPVKYQVADKYSNGKEITVGDVLRITNQASLDNEPITSDSDPVTVMNVYVINRQEKELGAGLDGSTEQTSVKPGKLGGYIAWEITPDGATLPIGSLSMLLQSPTIYLEIPDNATLAPFPGENADSLYNDVEISMGPNFTNVTPKSISIIKVGPHRFAKIDLSNYAQITQSLYPEMYLNNIPDIATATDSASALVVAKGVGTSTNQIKFPVSQLSSGDEKNTLLQLMKQEGISDADTLTTTPLSWQTLVSTGVSQLTMAEGNLSTGPALSTQSDDHKGSQLTLYGSTVNAENKALKNIVSVVTIPNTNDGKSQFNIDAIGQAKLINPSTGQEITNNGNYEILYGEFPANKTLDQVATGDNNQRQLASNLQFVTWDKLPVNSQGYVDTSHVGAVLLVASEISNQSSARLVIPALDNHIYDHVAKSVYLSSAMWNTNKLPYLSSSNTVAQSELLKPVTIEPGSSASAQLKVYGKSTIHTALHYQDSQGQDHYIALPDQDHTYNEGIDKMQQSDFPTAAKPISAADKALIPSAYQNYVVDYAHPTIKNSTEKYDNGYSNGTAAFGQTVKYDFDQDTVVFELKKPETPISDTATVHETIKYVYTNGSQAHSPYSATPLTFKRTGEEDTTTGKKTWNAWTPASQEFTAVTSPTIAGYTPDQAQIAAVTVHGDDQDVVKTVTYSPDAQKATVTYIDDTTGKILGTETLTGVSDQDSGYNTKDTITKYEGEHYHLVSDSTNGKNVVFDHDDQVDQHYEVHLSHTTEPASDTKTVTETITYVYQDGKTAQPTKTAQVTLKRTGTKDLVTNETAWQAWSTDQFKAVPTPTIAGYTPDLTTVPAVTVDGNTPDVVKKVTYSPDAQKATVTYIDDTTGKTLLTQHLTGVSDEDTGYNTKGQINTFENQHYQLVSDSTNGQNVVLDHNDKVDQDYEVHLTHARQAVNDSKQINETIHYVYATGGKAHADIKSTVTFTRSGEKDLVTRQIAWNNWEQNHQTFNAVPSPVIAGYLPDQPQINAITVTPTDQDIDKTVTYVVSQLAKVQYIDLDNNNALLAESNPLVGRAGDIIKYDTSAEIAQLEKQGYVLANNGFPDDAAFDNLNGNVQIFKVTFHHGIIPVTPDHPGAGYTKDELQKDITRTIHYIDANNGNTVAPDVQQSVHFTANGYLDQVTHQLVTVTNGQITGPGQLTWTPDQTISTVVSPKVNGEHISYISRDGDEHQNVKAVTLRHQDNSYDVDVIYTKDGQTTKNGQTIPASQIIHYVDDNVKPLHSDNVQTSQFTRTPDVIDTTTGQTISTGSWNETQHQFGIIDVPVIPGYITNVITAGGKTVTTDQPNVVQTIVYHQLGKIIPVDQNGKPIPNAPTPTYQNNPSNPTEVIPDEPTPTISGWKTKTPTVTPAVPTKDTPVVYTTPANQHAVVEYLDQDEGNREITSSGDLTGQPHTQINYSTAQTLQNLYQQGYVLVNNGFDYDGQQQYYDNDSHVTQVFLVTLKHGQSPVDDVHPNKNVSPSAYTKPVVSVVHYVGAGVQTPADYTQKATWTRTLTIDDVTGQVVPHGQYDQEWQPSQKYYDAVKTPIVAGYQPDQTVVPSKQVTFDNQYTVVTYHQVPSSSATPGSTPGSTPTSGSSATPGSNPSSTPTSGSSATPGSNPGSTPTSGSSAKPGSTPSSTPTSGSSAKPGSNPGSTPTSGSSATPGSNPSSTPTSGSSAKPGSNPSSTPTSGSSATLGSTPSSTPTSGSSATPGSNPSSTPTSGSSAKPDSTPGSTPTSGSSATPGSNPGSTPTSGSSATPGSTPSSTPTSDSSATPGSTPSSTPTSGSSATPGSIPTSNSSIMPGSNPMFESDDHGLGNYSYGINDDLNSNGGLAGLANSGMTNRGYYNGITTVVTNGAEDQTNSVTQQGKLPQTGDSNEQAEEILGLAGITATAGLMGLAVLKKRDKN